MLLDVADEPGQAVADQIVAAGHRAVFQHADVASESDWAAAKARIDRDYGRVDVLFSNAYWVKVQSAVELTPADWRRQLDVSLTGAFLGAHTLLDRLRETAGSIVLTSSVHAVIGLPGHPAYAAAKGGLCALGRQLAVDYAPQVRVNVVLPGPIMTAAWDRVNEADRAQSVTATPLARFGQSSEVAAAVAFLASAEASFITGANWWSMEVGPWPRTPLDRHSMSTPQNGEQRITRGRDDEV